MKKSNFVITHLIMILALFCQTGFGQTTEFTYQGRLLSGTRPANGSHDFEFSLHDAASGGVQIGATVTLTEVNVNNGVFSVRIDFGNAFPGASRYLEIKVRESGSGAEYAVLTPRQAISSSPYSIKSLNAENASNSTNATNAVTAVNAQQLGGIPANQFVVTADARLSDSRNPLPNSPSYIQNNRDIPQPNAFFNISGSGTAGGLFANIISAATQYNLAGLKILSVSGPFDSGSFPLAASNTFAGENAGINTTPSPTLNSFTGKFNSFFGSNAGRDNTTGSNNSFYGRSAGHRNTTASSNSFFGDAAGNSTTTGGSNSFFGNATGLLNTTGFSNAFFGSLAGRDNTSGARNSFFGNNAGLSNTTGQDNSFFGIGAGSTNTSGSGNSFFGVSAGSIDGLTNATALGGRAFVSRSNSLVLGSINGINGATANTFVGIGTVAPTAKLMIAGSGSYTSSNAARFDLFNTTAGTGYFQHVLDNGRWQLGSGDSTIILVEANGNVGIGTGALDKLQVAGDVRIGTGTTGCVKDANGSVIAGICSSDARFKQSITAFPKMLDRLALLRPVYFFWKSKDYPDKGFGDVRSFGLLAQEVEEVLPDLVSEDEKGFKAVNYSQLPLLMLQAIKDLKTENDSLREELRQKSGRDEALQRQIDEQKETIKLQQTEIEKQTAELRSLKQFLCSQNPTAGFCQPKN